jgi:hypothetical protein
VIQPWHRLSRESDDAYSAFCRYLNMGSERSLDNFTTAIGEMQVSVEQLASWASAFSWTKRVALSERYVQDELINGCADLSASCTHRQLMKLPMNTRRIGKRLRANRLTKKGKIRYPTH